MRLAQTFTPEAEVFGGKKSKAIQKALLRREERLREAVEAQAKEGNYFLIRAFDAGSWDDLGILGKVSVRTDPVSKALIRK